MHNENFSSVCWWHKSLVRRKSRFDFAAGRFGNEFLGNFYMTPYVIKNFYLILTIENPYLLKIIHRYRLTFDDHRLSYAIWQKKALLNLFKKEIEFPFLAIVG